VPQLQLQLVTYFITAVQLQESVTESHKDEVSSSSTSGIPKLLELNLEEAHKMRNEALEGARKLAEDETRNKSYGSRDGDRSLEMGSADARRYELGRSGSRTDDRPPTKRMRDEPYRNQRDDGYGRDRTRGGRGRGKVDSYRSGGTRGGRSSANDSRYTQGRDGVVSEYQPSRGEKRGTLTFERSDLHSERPAFFDNKRGQFRLSDSGSRQDRNRDGRGKESSSKRDERSGAKLPEGSGTTETVVSSALGGSTTSSDREPIRTNAWSQPLQGTKQSSEPPTQSDEVPDATQWPGGSQPLSESTLSQQEGGADLSSKNAAGTQPENKSETESQLVETQGNDRDSGKRTGFRTEDYRSDRGRRQSRRGQRPDWADLVEAGESMPSRYPRRSNQRRNREGRGPRTTDDGNEEVDEGTFRDDRYQMDGRRTARYGSGGRGHRQPGYSEYPVRSRGRGMLMFYLAFFTLNY